MIKTTRDAVLLELRADRGFIEANGKDLSFITVRVTDANGNTVPQADHQITFEISGPGEILATDNGDPTSFVPFPSRERKAFHGLALVIIRSKPEDAGKIKVTAKSPGLKEAHFRIESQ